MEKARTAGAAQMQENPEESDFDSAINYCRRCKKISHSILSYINKRTKKGGTVHSGNRGNEVEIVYSG